MRPFADEDPVPLECLLVSFEGEYNRSRPSNDVTFMRGAIVRAIDSWTHHGLIVDLSAFAYVWGDEMASVICSCAPERSAGDQLMRQIFGGLPYPIPVVLGGPNSMRGLFTLIRDELDWDPDLWLFDSLESCLASIHQRWLQAHRSM